MVTYTHNSLEYLLRCLRETLLIDFELTFNDQTVSCHKAIVSQSSKRLQTLIQKNQDSYDLGDDDEASIEHLISIIKSFYGEVLALNAESTVPLLFLSKSLSCSDLNSACKNFVKTHDHTVFQMSMKTILENLSNDNFSDHQIIFHNQSLHIHKFLFAAISPYFKAKFSRNWQESEENTTDFTKLLQVSPSSFINFFTSFYNGNLEVNLENAFDYSHLAWYFQLSELEKFVNNFIENSDSEYNWVTSSVLKAINSEDYRFIKIISSKISEIPNLSSCDPIPVHPLFFENLTSNIDVSWLLKCLIFSYSNYSEENVWTPKSLEKSFEKIKFDTLPIDEIYQIIEPLFSISDLFDFLSSFSLSIFSKFTSQVPLNWFTWFVFECDKRKEFNLISQVSELFNEIITPENISQVPITSFNSETLLLFAIITKKEHLVIWMINCLIELWSNSQLNVEEFSKILMSIDISESQYELVYSTLSRLFSDEILRPILFEFNSLKLVPRLLKDALEEKKRLGIEMIKQEKINIEQKRINEELKTVTNQQSKTIKEQSKSIEQLMADDNEQKQLISEQEGKIVQLQNQLSNISLSFQKISDQQRTALEVELKAKEEQKRINEQLQNQLVDINKVLEPIIKQQQQQQQQAMELKLKQERDAKEAEERRLAELERSRTKFLASNKGSSLSLSENDCLVSKVSGGRGENWDNAFVQINHPVKGKVVLTPTSFGRYQSTFIGLFHESHIQTSSCYNNAHALLICKNYTQFRINNSSTGPHPSSIISINQQIIIEFNNQQVTFSIPTCNYSHTITWPSNHVFGLAIGDQGNSWRVSSS
ncbi:hypothetical protein RCL1_002586 [Eukaryota sp. TZLM3-RCL]